MALVLLLLAPLPLAASTGGAGEDACAPTLESRLQRPPLIGYTEDPAAALWPTWLVPVGAVRVPPPPGALSPQAIEERAELARLAQARTPAQVEAAARWDDGPAGAPWEDLALRLVAEHGPSDPSLNPPRISRMLALLEATLHDALVAAWDAKYCHQRAPPYALDPTLGPTTTPRGAPSYPSEHAVAAAAAATVLAAFFPTVDLSAQVEEAAMSRLWAGANHRSDVEAGLALGRGVAALALAARADDGSAQASDPVEIPSGPCRWSPTIPAYEGPLEPRWGEVAPWLMPTSEWARPAPPPACGSDEEARQARALYDASLVLDDEQARIAHAWAGGPGTETPPGMGLRAAWHAGREENLTTMGHARLMSHVAAAVADAGIAAWDTKFTYWHERPVHVVRRTIDPEWTPLLATPPFPGYVSGHATFSGAAFGVLAGFFPARAPAYDALAQEAAVSRFYGGIHVEADNVVGLEVGGAIAELALARAHAYPGT